MRMEALIMPITAEPMDRGSMIVSFSMAGVEPEMKGDCPS